MIVLGKGLENEIRKQGEEGYPREICGFLLGNASPDGEKAALRLLPAKNESEDEIASRRFVISAESFLRAEKEAAASGCDIVGVYHTHPDWPAKPSEYDFEHSLPFYSYIILSVRKGKAEEIFSYELESGRSGFAAEEIRRLSNDKEG